MKVLVSEADWRCGLTGSRLHCALALAIKREVPGVYRVVVDHGYVIVNDAFYNDKSHIARAFDAGVQPPSFPVEVELTPVKW